MIKSIDSLQQYLLEIGKIQTRYDTFVYRGQSDYRWRLNSGVHRRIESSKKLAGLKPTVNHQEVIDYLREKIAEAKKRISVHQQAELQEMNDINILVEMQHYGAATNLIDFSYNALMALYFACSGSYDMAGKIFCINYTNPYKVLWVNNGQLYGHDLLSKLFPSPVGKFYTYSPNHSNPRIVKQDSIFIFNDVGVIEESLVDYVFLIKAASKDSILQNLKDFAGITEESIYPDFLGYLQANNHRTPFKIKNALDYFEQGVLAHKKRNFSQAIGYYKLSLEMDSEQTRPHLEMARCLRMEEKFDEALKSCDQLLEKDTQNCMAWNERGIVYTYKHDYLEATSSFKRAKELINDNIGYKKILINNEGWMYVCFGEYEKAIKILTEIINDDKAYHQTINMAHCYLFKKDKLQALQYYSMALGNARTQTEFWEGLDADFRLMPMTKFGVTIAEFEEIKRELREIAKAKGLEDEIG